MFLDGDFLKKKLCQLILLISMFDYQKKVFTIDHIRHSFMNMHIIRMKYIYNTCALSKHIGNTHIYLYAFDSAHVLYLSCNFKS